MDSVLDARIFALELRRKRFSVFAMAFSARFFDLLNPILWFSRFFEAPKYHLALI